MNEKKTYKDPLILQRADPWIYRHTDGFYYFTASVPEYDGIEIRKAENINALRDAKPHMVWRKHGEGPQSHLIWAPEIHHIDGKWYVYYAAGASCNVLDHRMFVIENDAEDPTTGVWLEKGQIRTNWDSFALDATTFLHGRTRQRYLVWAQQESGIEGNSNLYIAKMKNPWTIEGEQVMLTKPELPWETIGFLVNEGPAVLEKNGKIYLTYSASATDHNYCMGLLTAEADCDPLDSRAWKKSQEPVFETSKENSQYGPGHSCFTVVEEGDEDLLVYHARSYREIEGDPLYDPNRHTRVQRIRFGEDGRMLLGKPGSGN
ncbi:glycoside hydrolase family 43 protein [Anaerotalea alkaliphila]|uniref:Family 43 glycosylhydrolase n=1 Tax=Anaerotalea alkaliphila TaxID=2662126 RepID=A0A7X5KPF9_9FIRM|nr:family 43 glycosylhydrolase [Anaerotalea alkaliphila]NDL68042.1 family 43 glycosylhydrolase [Anaerotalea alkaliphila]